MQDVFSEGSVASSSVIRFIFENKLGWILIKAMSHLIGLIIIDYMSAWDYQRKIAAQRYCVFARSLSLLSGNMDDLAYQAFYFKLYLCPTSLT